MSARATLGWAALWAAAFGLVEGAIVVYLREIAYPDGFRFPLLEIPPRLLATEIAREAATIVMLLGVAKLAVTGGMRRFGTFAFCFGVWDVAYYLALYAILRWPPSLMTWDVLFLIPATWTSPVLAPVLVSASLILAGARIVAAPAHARFDRIGARDWTLFVLAGLVIVLAFCWNHPAVAAGEVPRSFPWWLFGLGWAGGTGLFLLRWPAVVSDE